MHMTMRWASQGKDSLEWENQVNHPIMKVCEEHGTVLGVTGGFGGKKPQARLMCRVTKRKGAVDRWRAETSLVGRGSVWPKAVKQEVGFPPMVLLTDFYSNKSVFLAQVTLLARTVGAQANT